MNKKVNINNSDDPSINKIKIIIEKFIDNFNHKKLENIRI
jgi:hypothetical protein